MAERGVPYPSLDTPCVLLDLDKLEANLREMSQLAAEAGVRLRPHVKVHQCALIAKMQIEAGACGIEVGTVAQAESMVEEGIDDIIIAHPTFYGVHKSAILKKLLDKPGIKIAVVVDMVEQAENIAQLGREVGRKVPLLLKIETNRVARGGARFGVFPGEPALQLAKRLSQLQGIEFTGIYAHEIGAGGTPEGVERVAFETAEIMAETAQTMRREGITVNHVSVGASPTFRATCRYIKEGKFPELTEIHPGQCVIGDIMYMRQLGNTRESCALTVLTTVMSTSHLDWAMIDAGYKTFGNDPLIAARDTPGFSWRGMPSFGFIQGRTDLWLGALSAESAHVFYMELEKKKLSLGERLEIVPNNATLVINIHDSIHGVRNGVVERTIPVTGRGCGN